jgi:molybdopterin converting factor small subunit
MPRVTFTSNLQRHVAAPTLSTGGTTVGAALDEVFASNPRLRSYILDDQGRVRRHISIFRNGGGEARRAGLDEPVAPADEIFVFQALSGG